MVQLYASYVYTQVAYMRAQANGWRCETDTVEKMQRRVEHDMHCIRNWSLALDMKIVALTVVRGFVGPGAY